MFAGLLGSFGLIRSESIRGQICALPRQRTVQYPRPTDRRVMKVLGMKKTNLIISE
jgi:hypothetical protein